MKPKLTLVKRGALAIVYLNPETDTPESAHDLDSGPPDCFPTPMRVEDAIARYAGRYDLEWLSPPAAPERLPVNSASPEEVQAVLNGIDPVAPKPPSMVAPAAPSPANGELLIFRELEIMFAARQSASGKKRKELDAELQAVGNFLVRVFPQSLPILQQLSQRFSEVQSHVF